MVESRRDKFIRLLFILFFISIVIFGFFLRYKEFLIDEEKPLNEVALVLHPSTGTDNPQIIMYRQHDGQHFLVKYEIDINNNYFFRTLQAVELNHSVDELFKDKEEGFWLSSNGKFYYFDLNLTQHERLEQYIGETTAVPYMDEEGTITVSSHQFVANEIGKIRQIHSLSKNGDIWLVLSELGPKILTIDTN